MTGEKYVIVPQKISMEVPQIFTKVIKSGNIYESSVIVVFQNNDQKFEGQSFNFTFNLMSSNGQMSKDYKIVANFIPEFHVIET